MGTRTTILAGPPAAASTQQRCSLPARHMHCAVAALKRQHTRKKKLLRAPTGLKRLIVATSEFWWEEEDEFDALTDTLDRKYVYLVASPPPGSAQATDSEATAAAAAAARTALRDLTFQSGFASEASQAFAEALWEGRSSPPYFYKMRYRVELGARESAPGFWEELLAQNWRVELGYGLSSQQQAAEHEALLVVAPPGAAAALLAAALPQNNGSVQQQQQQKEEEESSGGGSGIESPSSLRQPLEPGSVTVVVFRAGSPPGDRGQLATALAERAVKYGVPAHGAALPPL